MALFRLQINSIKRSEGRSAVGAAAYRAGERLRDERTDEVHNHSRRNDVTHSEIMLPAHLSGPDTDWARSRVTLWNAVEEAESRKGARVAREFQVNLPSELSASQRLQLARGFSQEIADHYNIAVDLSVHDPRPGSDPRNFHAHLLATTREVTATGLGAKAGLDMHPDARRRLGLPGLSEEFTAIRARWATLTNEALREANIDARVDHRSLAAQGIDREPRPHVPFAAYQIEKSGRHSEVAERLREQYSSRVEARSQAQDERAMAAAQTGAPRSLEEIRRDACEAWLKMRAGPAPSAAPASLKDERAASADDDFSL